MHHFWASIFGNANPVEIEVGSGTGTFLLEAAAQRPATNWFGIEHSHRRTARLQQAIIERGAVNVRVLCADAACVIANAIPEQSVSAYHVYFPDPWWKRRHHRRRLFSVAFAHALRHTLIPGGRVYVATDVEDVFELIMTTMVATCGFELDPHARSPRTTVTRFEHKGLACGARIHEAGFIRRAAYAGALTGAVNSAAPITPAESPS